MDSKNSIDNKKTAKQRLKEQKNKWLNAEGFPDFLSETIHGILVLTVYFYFGINFNLLAKSAQLNPGGLRGQDLDGPPYVGNFSECKNNENNITESISNPESFMSKWSFPYKNSIKCNAVANRQKPLYFRIVTWTTSVIAFSYAMGRKGLNFFLSNTSDWVNMLFGPIMMVLILIITPLFTWCTSLVGIFVNIDKLLPSCYWTFWFPVITLLLFLWGFFTYPTTLVLYHLLTIIYFLFFHVTVSKFPIQENGETKTVRGIISILTRILGNSLWYLGMLIIAAISAYKHLGLAFSIPIMGWIGFIIVTKYLYFLYQ